MSDGSDRLFEKALDREINGVSPADSMGIAVVGAKAFDLQERVKQAVFIEDDRWDAKQDEMYAKGISDTCKRWLDAQKSHELLIEGYQARLASLGKLGTVR